MSESSELSSTPKKEQEAELKLTAENKTEFLMDLAGTLNTLERNDYRHKLALLKVRRAEKSGNHELVEQLWREFPQGIGSEENNQASSKYLEMHRAIRKSEVYSGLRIFRPDQAKDEAFALVCNLPPEEKSKFKFLIAQKMRNEMMSVAQPMREAFDWCLRNKKSTRGEMSIEEAVIDYNNNMTRYPEQQITGEQGEEVRDFYNGKTTQRIVDKYREHIPPDMVEEVLEYDPNFVKGA